MKKNIFWGVFISICMFIIWVTPLYVSDSKDRRERELQKVCSPYQMVATFEDEGTVYVVCRGDNGLQIRAER